MTSNTLFRLLQISDSAFPRGAFAHSLGLETFVQEEKISNAEEKLDALDSFRIPREEEKE